jgi:predicted LPLAT superfamily acyltransferase
VKRRLRLRLLGFGFLQDVGRRLSRGVRKPILGYFLFSDKTAAKSCECWRYKIEGRQLV